ncbi:MAG: hypothetical protein B6242_14200 [Anaerolineaceae bacterium 4572_78]|nr:MAG: hypothetical protein B6242_14200 [Anaerolineaceae bacterium 4572_78]
MNSLIESLRMAFRSLQFESLGTNLISVSANTRANDGTGQRLTIADAQAIENAMGISGIEAIAPTFGGNGTATYEGTEYNTSITGVTPQYQSVRAYDVTVGKFIDQEMVDYRKRVAVLGKTIVDELFPNMDYPIGETIRLNDVPFEVIGVLEEKGQSGPMDNDDIILIPLSTAQTRLFNASTVRGEKTISRVDIESRSEDDTDGIIAGVTKVLRKEHRLQEDDDDDFYIGSQAALLESFSTVTAALTAFLGTIAGISLLVGGIGIMNIMLVSVTERTREIGLRKAIGAGRHDILFQFIIEAMVLSLGGGLMGLMLGIGGSQLAGYFMEVDIPVTADIILLATGFSAGVGLFFGIYPAMRAANLNPIEALRYE